MNIFVSRLSSQTQSDDLRKIFQIYGVIISTHVATDRVTGRSRGFGFVQMENESDALRAIRELNNSFLQGRNIIVKKSRTPR